MTAGGDSAREKLSLIIITHNEEADIQACLGSVSGLVDEIILVDSGSTDRTIEIAKKFTDKIYMNAWPGYSAQKQFALNKAKGPWILNIDADERVSPELKKEIADVLARPSEKKGFEIPFHHYFLGRRLRFGGLQGETHLRLFLKQNAQYGKRRVHEGIEIQGPVGRLRHPILHTSYRTIEEYLRKCNEYTTAIAREKSASGKTFHLWHHVRLPFEFVTRYFFRGGFLDGEAGLTYALLSSYYVWMKFLKLRDEDANV